MAEYRTYKGGSWYNPYWVCESSYYYEWSRSISCSNKGFRVLLVEKPNA